MPFSLLIVRNSRNDRLTSGPGRKLSIGSCGIFVIVSKCLLVAIFSLDKAFDIKTLSVLQLFW